VTGNITTTTFKLGGRYPKPEPPLKRLEVLVDTWNTKGCESGPDGETHIERSLQSLLLPWARVNLFKEIKNKLILKLFKTKTFNCRNVYFTTILTKKEMKQ
jgi:hypothetical protein